MSSRALWPRAHDDDGPHDSEEDCHAGPVALGRLPLRIGAIFILLLLTLLAALVPLMVSRRARVGAAPRAIMFVFKYVGTGVIIATAWMHLLAPAIEQLGNECVGHVWPVMAGYPWALCIGLMTIMAMLLLELVVSSVANDHDGDDGLGHTVTTAGSCDSNDILALKKSVVDDEEENRITSRPHTKEVEAKSQQQLLLQQQQQQGAREGLGARGGLAGQLAATLMLEFGVVFHSVFIGLTLGTTTDDKFNMLLVVLVFHQMLEGLGLGTRLAVTPWPARRGWIPWMLALGFALSTPMGMAAAIGTKPPSEMATQRLINGIFDAISAGILMYTGLVELLAHELLFEPGMRRAPLRRRLAAYGCVAVGVFAMALLAKWA
ncbi:hypothetical protein CP533_3312 [Ophiocordyceps camponoti-saundersi (nom. inval.)]|nr:hypothetical protein CP533_3312 [Ophiocordyceps camponoti-saundersi (nom. inval.)]